MQRKMQQLTDLKVLVLRVRVSVTTFSATTGVSGVVIALFSSTFVFIYTCNSYIRIL